MSALAVLDRVDLGLGHAAELHWRSGVDRVRGLPAGATLRHGSCAVRIFWALAQPEHRPDDLWELVSLDPLTVWPPVHCTVCQLRFSIEGGAVRL